MRFMEDLRDFNALTYRLQYLIRYSNVPRIKDESVASHSFFVATIVLFLHEWYKFDLSSALGMAICHDLPEARVNDMCHETKKAYPELNKMMNEFEVRVAEKELPKAAREFFLQYMNDDKSPEAKIVKFADAIQCYQYSCNEVLMGNRGYMEQVQTNSRARIEEMLLELQPFITDKWGEDDSNI